MAEPANVEQSGVAPSDAGLVLAALILVAAVANLNLAVANVALPSIGQAFDSSQTMLDLIAQLKRLGAELLIISDDPQHLSIANLALPIPPALSHRQADLLRAGVAALVSQPR